MQSTVAIVDKEIEKCRDARFLNVRTSNEM